MGFDADTFLAEHGVFCARMSARILPKQCDVNRGRKMLSCEGCSGPVGVEPMVAHIVSGDKEKAVKSYQQCIELGCTKFRVRHQRCTVHANEFEALSRQPSAPEKSVDEAGGGLPNSPEGNDRCAVRPLDRLLVGSPQLKMVLDFTDCPELFTALRDVEIDECQIVVLLQLLVNRRLSVAL